MLSDRPLKFILLTHSRELAKSSNTGQLALDHPLIQAKRVVWSRTEPDQGVLSLIEQGKVCLAWPNDPAGDGDRPVASGDLCPYCIIIDATWQEARKIYNRSAYLKDLPRLTVQPSAPSRYTLRRNQTEGGLSTAECIAALLDARGQSEAASSLLEALSAFQQAWQQGRPSAT